MNFDIALLLAQDGITNGAIYALLALALVLVFAVTRVIFIPQGEFVAYGALTLAALQAGKLPGTLWLLLAGRCAGRADRGRGAASDAAVAAPGRGRCCGISRYPLALLAAAARCLPATDWPMAAADPAGAGDRRAARADDLSPGLPAAGRGAVLVLLIVSVAVHFVLVGLGLLMFGAEGSRTRPFSEGSARARRADRHGQSLWVIGCSLALIVAAVLLLRAHALRQGAARHRDQPRRRAADGHPDRVRRAAGVLPLAR